MVLSYTKVNSRPLPLIKHWDENHGCVIYIPDFRQDFPIRKAEEFVIWPWKLSFPDE
jgi:hypothetical protein